MTTSMASVKIEDGAITNDDTKTDAAETVGSVKIEKDTAMKESKGSDAKADESKTADADGATEPDGSAADSSSDTETDEKEKKVKVKTEDSEGEMKVEAENKSDSESTTTDEDSTAEEEKSIGANGWDNNYSNELQKMYSNVDPDTRAVAEEMIRAVRAGSKNTKQKSQDKPKPPSPTSKDVADSSDTKPASPPDDSKPANPDAPISAAKKAGSTIIKNGKEPSALELALKQQGITQSDQLRSTQFPFRLHNMLDDAERSGHAHIVSWCPGGDSFKIHKPTKLINVLQKYFRQSKFKSFLRQLQGYNFKRITRGKDQGVVSHPLFLRGRRSVSTLMRRKRVGPKVVDTEAAQANKTAAAALGNPLLSKKPLIATDARAQPTMARILPAPQIVRSAPQAIHPAPSFLNKTAAQAPKAAGVINPNAQDVLCVDYPNGHQVQQFQGNRKLASIVQKIQGHYTSANESVRTMIVNEISSRIQNSGSRFLKLTKDGLSWVECNREEMFRKVISCFEQEIVSKEKAHIDLAGDSESPAARAVAINKVLPGIGNPALHGVPIGADPGRRIPPRNQDVVLRGGPGSEREGNTYLKTMIQANVGQQLDSFEMKRIKCRAILERMKRRGSRFFLKLKETDSDDEMYILSDAEAQDVIYTAFCAEEKKVQSLLVETPTAASVMRAKALAGLDVAHPGLPGLGPGLGGASQFAASMAGLQSDAALLSQLKANNDISLLASQNPLKRPMPGHAHLSHENLIEKRLRAETDEHIKILIERERQRRADPYAAAGLAGRLPFNARSGVMESSLRLSTAFGGAAATSSSIDQYLKDRQTEELLKQAAAARAPYTAGPTPGALGAELPKSNNHFVEFLKKKYVKSPQERAW